MTICWSLCCIEQQHTIDNVWPVMTVWLCASVDYLLINYHYSKINFAFFEAHIQGVRSNEWNGFLICDEHRDRFSMLFCSFISFFGELLLKTFNRSSIDFSVSFFRNMHAMVCQSSDANPQAAFLSLSLFFFSECRISLFLIVN